MSLTFLSDSPHSEGLVAKLSQGAGTTIICHQSGNEWVIGQLNDFLVLFSQDRRVGLITDLSATASQCRLQDRVDAVSDIAAAQKLLAEIAGDGIVAISFDGHQLLSASISGSSSIYWTTSKNGVIASDSAFVLARTENMTVSLPRLALRLNRDLPLYPFALLPLWDHVDRLHPHSYLHLPPMESPRTQRWWKQPAVTFTLEQGANQVRHSLLETLGRAVEQSDSVTCDLSGGLDSTSIAYALSALGEKPTTFHSQSINPRNEDLNWARRAADDLSLDLQELPALGSAAQAFLLKEPVLGFPITDQPVLWTGSSGFLDKLQTTLGTRGRITHFTGIGGDELFGPVPAISWSLFNEGGLKSLSAVKRLCVAARTPFVPVLVEVLSRTSFARSLAALPANLKSGAGSAARSGSWFARPSWPENMSAYATALATDVLTEDVNPEWRIELNPDRGRHQMLESLIFQGEVQLQINQVHGGTARWDSPFLKRSMIEAVSAVPMQFRLGSTTAKPVLAQTMMPLSMPRAFFERRVSGEYSADTYAEFAKRRQDLHIGIQTSLLAKAKLINVDVMQAALSNPAPSPDFLSQVETFVAVENWLQAATLQGVGI